MNGMDEWQRRINEKMTSTSDRDMQAGAAALIALAEFNIPPDVQELLIRGNPDRSIKPGALIAALNAAHRVYTALTPQH